MKKIISILLISIMSIALVACDNQEIEASKTPFPEIAGVDMEGNSVTNDIFADYDATIVNFWNNGCGTCIEEMPEIEEYYQEFSEMNINVVGVGTDSGESDENYEFAKEILARKGVTYMNIAPDTEGAFFNEFIHEITSYPTTYVVDSDGNIIGSPIIGYLIGQDKTLRDRVKLATE